MTPEPICWSKDGQVFWRGVYHPLDECERLLTQFRGSGPWAAEHVRQLEQAIKEANTEHA